MNFRVFANAIGWEVMNLSKIKSYLLAGTAGVAIVPMMGLAVDQVANAAPPPMPVMSWAGWYVGLSVGGASQSNFFSNPDAISDSLDGTHKGSAFIGGGQIGYNWQQGQFVYGLEADFSGLSKSSGTYVTDASNGAIYGSQLSWMSTVRGRLGMTVGNGNTLVYGTAGLAIGGITSHSEGGIFGWPLNGYSSTRVGWAAGAGIEHMLTRNWTIGLEGLFADFGSYTKASTVEGKCCATVRDQVLIGRLKLNYKF